MTCSTKKRKGDEGELAFFEDSSTTTNEALMKKVEREDAVFVQKEVLQILLLYETNTKWRESMLRLLPASLVHPSSSKTSENNTALIDQFPSFVLQSAFCFLSRKDLAAVARVSSR